MCLQVDWQPYTRLGNDFVPVDLRAQLALHSSRTCLVCFNKVSHHRPDLAPQQFGREDWESIDTSALPSLQAIKQRSGPQSKHWHTHKDYVVFLQHWERRNEACLLTGNVCDLIIFNMFNLFFFCIFLYDLLVCSFIF